MTTHSNQTERRAQDRDLAKLVKVVSRFGWFFVASFMFANSVLAANSIAARDAKTEERKDIDALTAVVAVQQRELAEMRKKFDGANAFMDDVMRAVDPKGAEKWIQAHH